VNIYHQDARTVLSTAKTPRRPRKSRSNPD
jgi:hypothetical protein